MQLTHVYEVRPRKDRRGFDPISDVLLFGRLWYSEPNAVCNAIGYAKFQLVKTVRSGSNRRFEFDKRSQLFIRAPGPGVLYAYNR